MLNAYAQPSLESVPRFMTALEELRVTVDHQNWKKIVRSSEIIRRWRYFLSIDPYTRWGLLKPRGYAGDATLMDFAYGHSSLAAEIDGSGNLAKAIYAHTFTAKQSGSARLRIALIARTISTLAEREPGLRVLSLASGHARELEALPKKTRDNISRFSAIDADLASLEIAQISAGDILFHSHHLNVIKSDLPEDEKSDLVYSLGLFDYLSDEHAETLIRKMWKVTASGGRIVVANLAPDAANLGFCEAIMDWWMIPRDETQMRSLGNVITQLDSAGTEVSVAKHGCFNYLEINRSSALEKGQHASYCE